MQKNGMMSTGFSVLTAALLLSQAVLAKHNPPKDMKAWALEAHSIVQNSLVTADNGMIEDGSTSFSVTVNKDGELVAYSQENKEYGRGLNTVATGLITSVRFPDLPRSYKADSLTFNITLNFSNGASGRSVGAALTAFRGHTY